ELGRTPRIDDLVDVPPDDLVEAARTITTRLPRRGRRWGAVAHTPTPFSPVVESPWAALGDGTAQDVELLIGHTRDEFSLLATRLGGIGETEVDTLIDGLTPTPGAQRYRAAYPSVPPNVLRDTALSDWLYRMPAIHLAEAAHAGGARVWVYELCWGFGSAGASHGLDTLLVFGTAHINTGLTEAGREAMAQARQLGDLIRSEHLSFATTGDPGWPRHEPHDRATRSYDTTSTVDRYPEESSRRIWRDQRFGTLERSGPRGPVQHHGGA
ncbi:MAG TPA: carboxylesterase/lipase family protein, partial [Pseudonocardiaceae bacterium]|nr:carboxylesterase/lipase family protein [Pseudonocardiaceae bacterium]